MSPLGEGHAYHCRGNVINTHPARGAARVSAHVGVVGLCLTLLGLSLVTAVPASAATGPIKQRTSAVATADALPTAQIDGVAFAQVIAGNTVFAGGSFTGVRPAGAKDNVSEVPRYNLMAYNLTTGAYTAFAPNINGVVKELALSSDQKTLYVGGKFNLVNNVKRENFAAITIATGALTSLAPVVNDSVNAITVVGTTIYLGGAFNNVAGKSRAHLAAISASTGVPTNWAPSVANGVVQALVATPDRSRVIAGGNFDTLAGSTALGMGSVDAVSGAIRPWKVNTIVKNKGESAAILTLNVDGDTVYGGGYSYGGGAAGGNFEGVFAADPTTGNVKWLQDCHGDTYDVAPVGNTVYSVGHAHYCANIGGFPDTNPRVGYYRALAVTKEATGTVNKNGQAGANYGDFGGQPAPSLYNWFPNINSGDATETSQGAWSIRGTSQYISVAGEFTAVNGDLQQGLVRLALPTVAGNPVDEGPVDTDAGLVTTAGVTGTSVTVGWKANWDRDDQVLSYDILRNNVLLKTVKVTSQFWRRPALSFVDKTGTPGTSYTYKVRVRDPDNNSATSPATVAVIYPSDTAYAQLVNADGATHQWRLGSPLGDAPDTGTVGGANLSNSAGVTTEKPGAFKNDADTAAKLDGSANAKGSTAPTALPAGPVSVEAWFKTSSTAGGALVGFDAGATVTGDRQIYLTSTGRVAFAARGATGGTVDSATSETAYADGKWHQVVAVQSATGLVLFVDGARVATDSSSQQLPALTGSWTLGGGTDSGLPGAPSGYLTGAVDDVSVTASALTVRQVYEHYRTGTQRYVLSDSGTTRR